MSNCIYEDPAKLEHVGWQCREYDVLEEEWSIWFTVNSQSDAAIYQRYPARFQLRKTYIIKE